MFDTAFCPANLKIFAGWREGCSCYMCAVYTKYVYDKCYMCTV